MRNVVANHNEPRSYRRLSSGNREEAIESSSLKEEVEETEEEDEVEDLTLRHQQRTRLPTKGNMGLNERQSKYYCYHIYWKFITFKFF